MIATCWGLLKQPDKQESGSPQTVAPLGETRFINAANNHTGRDDGQTYAHEKPRPPVADESEAVHFALRRNRSQRMVLLRPQSFYRIDGHSPSRRQITREYRGDH